MKTVLGIFSDREEVEDAIDELEENGYKAKDISVIMKHVEPLTTEPVNRVASGTVTATTGAAIGGLAGGAFGGYRCHSLGGSC